MNGAFGHADLFYLHTLARQSTRHKHRTAVVVTECVAAINQLVGNQFKGQVVIRGALLPVAAALVKSQRRTALWVRSEIKQAQTRQLIVFEQTLF